MTSHYVRLSRNFVNLGRLYSVPPWSTVAPYGLERPQINSVNLGNLYKPITDRRPPGWGYFDDGSILVVPYGWLPHHMFEARMKIAAHFVNDPSPRLQVIRQQNHQMNRLILINKDGRAMRRNTLHILARNAYSGQRVTVVDPQFEDVVLHLDETGQSPTSAQFKDAPQLKIEHRLRNSEALENFRGTLVDGILQPNVRLGNGLRLSNKPDILKPQLQEKRRPRNLEALREDVGLPPRASAEFWDRSDTPSSRNRPLPQAFDPQSTQKPPQRNAGGLPSAQADNFKHQEIRIAQREQELIQLQQQILFKTMRSRNARSLYDRESRPSPRGRSQTQTQARGRSEVELELKMSDINAKERELEQREEVLRWKRRAWILEQKLAIATGGPLSTAHERCQDDPGVLQRDPVNVHPSLNAQKAPLTPSIVRTDVELPFSGFGLDTTAPPKALTSLRSRLQSSTRRTLRAKRVSRP